MSGPAPTDEWAVALGTLFLLKQQIEQRERPSLIGYSTAKVAATPAELDQARTRLGGLPDSLASWFSHANGWPEIYFDLSMLPLARVLAAADAASSDDTLAVFLDTITLPGPAEHLLVVGSTPTSSNRVLVNQANGTTVWLDEDDTQHFESMYEFIQALIGMHQVYLDKHAGL